MLEPGIHLYTIKQAIAEFCNTEERTRFIEPLDYAFRYAYETGAKSILIGGSFISDKPRPNDLDFLIIYEKDSQIPTKSEKFSLFSVALDFLFCSNESLETVDLYIHLFSHNRDGSVRGLIQINIDGNDAIKSIAIDVDKKKFELVKDTYLGRQIVEQNAIKGMVISIHGLLSNAEWNVDLAPIVSSQGWIFAPYVYHNPNRSLLFSKNKRKRTVDDFREWIYAIAERYKDQTDNLSIVAHSYGTYLLGEYLNGFDDLPVKINSIILTGCILNINYDWQRHFEDFKIGRVLNIYSKNDKWVKRMPNKPFKKYLGMSPLFGSGGYAGFTTQHKYLIQRELEILNHTNTIKRDVVEQIWMPFLNLNCNSLAVNQIDAGVGK